MKTETELRELDAWIAEHVFGAVWELIQRKKARLILNGEVIFHRHAGSLITIGYPEPNFHPSTDPAAAMLVWKQCLVKARELGYELSMELDDLGHTHINGDHPVAMRLLAIDKTMEGCIVAFARKLFSK